jgi:hypothetical protein
VKAQNYLTLCFVLLTLCGLPFTHTPQTKPASTNIGGVWHGKAGSISVELRVTRKGFSLGLDPTMDNCWAFGTYEIRQADELYMKTSHLDSSGTDCEKDRAHSAGGFERLFTQIGTELDIGALEFPSENEFSIKAGKISLKRDDDR